MLDFKNAKFISIEGQDGSGKDTMVDSLEGILKDMGFIVITHSPYYNFDITRFAKDNIVSSSLDMKTELYSILTARFIDTCRMQSEILKYGDVVSKDYSNVIIIANRYTDSTYAYQCYVKGKEDEELIKCFHRWNKELCIPIPTTTLYLSCPSQVLKDRLESGFKELDGHEKKPIEFFDAIDRGFVSSLREVFDGERSVSVIDGTMRKEDVLGEAVDCVLNLID